VWSFVWGTTAKKRAVVFGKISGFEVFEVFPRTCMIFVVFSEKFEVHKLFLGETCICLPSLTEKGGEERNQKFFGCLRVAAPLKIF
jgi:hypothetical protein